MQPRPPNLLAPALFGLAHGISDFSAGLILGWITIQHGLTEAALAALVYNGLAFGAQPIAGLWLDQHPQNRRVLAASLGLMLLAIAACLYQPLVAAALAGIASAGFHAAGGGIILAHARSTAPAAGLFTAPGVMGLAAGFYLAPQGAWVGWLAAAFLAAAAVVSLVLPAHHRSEAAADSPVELPNLSTVAILLLAAFALRSAAWTTVQVVISGQGLLLLGLAAAASVGKLSGGFLAGLLGWRLWGFVSLFSSTLLLTWASASAAWEGWAAITGIFLLQSSTPVLFASLGQAFPRFPSTAASLALGTAVILGGLPAMFGMQKLIAHPAGMLLTCLAALAAFILVRIDQPLKRNSVQEV